MRVRVASRPNFVVLVLLPALVAAGTAVAGAPDDLSNQGSALQGEITGWGSFGSSSNTVHIDGPGDTYQHSETELDEWTVGVEAVYRPEGRYRHPEVPFFFVPYDFRSSYADLVASAGETNAKMEWEQYSAYTDVGAGEDSDTWYRRRISLRGRRYLERAYAGVSAGHSSLDSDGGPDSRLLTASAGGGYHDRRIQAGGDIAFSSSKWSNDSARETVRGSVAVEYTPRPTLRISGRVDHLLDDPDEREETAWLMDARVALPGAWWEFGLSGTFRDRGDEGEVVGGELFVGRHLPNLSASVSVSYYENESESYRSENRRFEALIEQRWDTAWLLRASLGVHDSEASDPNIYYVLSYLESGQARMDSESDGFVCRLSAVRLF